MLLSNNLFAHVHVYGKYEPWSYQLCTGARYPCKGRFALVRMQRIELRGRRPELVLETGQIMIDSGWGPEQLHDLVHHGLPSRPTEERYIFSLGTQRIHSSLREAQERQNLSAEECLLVEFDLEEGLPEPATLVEEDDWIRCVAIGRRGVLSGSFDRRIRFYPRNEPTNAIIIEGFLDTITALLWMDEDRFVAGAGDGSIRFYRMGCGGEERQEIKEEMRAKGHDSAIQAFMLSVDGSCLYSVDYDGFLCGFPTDSRSAQHTSKRIKGKMASFLELSRTTHWMAHQGTISGLFALEGHAFLSTGWDGNITFWPERRVLRTGSQGITSACLISNSVLVTAHSDGCLRMYDLESGSVIARRTTAHTGWINSLALDPSKRRLVSCGADGAVKVWSVDDLTEPVAVLRNQPSKVLSVDWREGLIAFGGEDKILQTFYS